jgi:hypothetical protein
VERIVEFRRRVLDHDALPAIVCETASD